MNRRKFEKRSVPLGPVRDFCEKIANVVNEAYGLDHNLVFSRFRHQPIAEARQVAMYILREQTNLTLLQIANFFNRRDHGTVVHACKQVRAQRETSRLFEENFKKVLSELAKGSCERN